MERRLVHRLAEVVPLLLATISGTIVTVSAVANPAVTAIPLWLWLALLVVHGIALALTTLLVSRLSDVAALVALAIASASAMALVVTAPAVGWIMIQLVFVVSTSAYLVPLGVSVGLVVVHSLAIVASMALSRQSPGAIAIGVLIYGLLQASGIVFVRIVLRETELRTEVQLANLSLVATRELLEESTRAAERVRIARDLHDVLGHQLTVLALELEAAIHAEEGAARDAAIRARATTRDLLADVREAVSALRVEDGDLERSLRRLVEGVADPRVHLAVAVDRRLSSEVTGVVVRAVQELLTNAIRHAEASEVWIEVRGLGERIVLDVRDDGPGASHAAAGNGLTGLRERVTALGGEVTIDRSAGFPVRVAVPA